jgi:hypothetical protein
MFVDNTHTLGQNTKLFGAYLCCLLNKLGVLLLIDLVDRGQVVYTSGLSLGITHRSLREQQQQQQQQQQR